jgi:hypothetical protein
MTRFQFIYPFISSTLKLRCIVIKVVAHGIYATLDLHIKWVVLQVDVANAFNIVIFHDL